MNRIRLKRKSGEESPISPLMQGYVKAVIGAALKDLNITEIHAQLAAVHVQIRIMHCILRDLQASATIAGASAGSSKQTLAELVDNLQTALGQNLAVLTDIQVLGYAEVELQGIHPMVAMADGGDMDESVINSVLENLRAQAEHTRGGEGEEFDEEDDMIENAMGEVDMHVDLSSEETTGERIRRRLSQHDVRGTGEIRPSQRRRRSAT